MEMMRVLVIIYFSFLTCGCSSSRKSSSKFEDSQGDLNIGETIEEAQEGIFKKMKKNGLYSEENSIVFLAWGQLRPEVSDSCPDLFLLRMENYDAFDEAVIIGSLWVSALVYDENGNNIGIVSKHTIIKNPSHYSFYERNLKLFELAKKEQYITYIKIFNCGEHFFGYGSNVLDIYKASEGKIRLEKRITD